MQRLLSTRSPGRLRAAELFWMWCTESFCRKDFRARKRLLPDIIFTDRTLGQYYHCSEITLGKYEYSNTAFQILEMSSNNREVFSPTYFVSRNFIRITRDYRGSREDLTQGWRRCEMPISSLCPLMRSVFFPSPFFVQGGLSPSITLLAYLSSRLFPLDWSFAQ